MAASVWLLVGVAVIVAVSALAGAEIGWILPLCATLGAVAIVVGELVRRQRGRRPRAR